MDPEGLAAFAVEDTSVQLTWKALPALRGTVGVGPQGAVVEPGPPAWLHRAGRSARRLSALPGGPGAVTVDGLTPDTDYDVWWQAPGGSRRSVGRCRTLRPPPGPLLGRFSTISDLHIGERRFGATDTIEDVHPRAAGLPPYPERAAAAAIDEAAAWGSTTMLVKGDLTARCRHDQFRWVVAALLAAPMVPLVQLGNHDRNAPVDLDAALAGVPVATRARPLVHDLDGLRLVLGDSPSPDDRRGHLDDGQLALIAAAARDAPGAVLVSFHHPPERWPVPVAYPPGFLYRDSRRLLAALAAANPSCTVVAGHTHRNRTYDLGGCRVAEVGSTKDHPGVWAGYAIHEGGLRQVVRRIARPDVLRWTEASGRALGGLWGRWSSGTISDRCWTRSWPERRRATILST